MAENSRLRTCLEAGLQAHRAGDLDTARTAYEQALTFVPDDPDALNLLGTALLQQGDPQSALPRLQQAASRQRNNPGVLGNLAQCHLALAQPREALDTFRKAARLDPRALSFQLGIAAALGMLGQFGEAQTLLQRLASRFPDDALVWFNLGNALRDQQRPAEALPAYNKALELDPDLLDARNNLGGVLQAMLQFEAAEREYRACLARVPDYFTGRLNLASVLIDMGRFAEAETQCRDLVRDAPGEYLVHTFLSAAVGHQGRLFETLACQRRAAELAPDAPRVAAGYAMALAETGNVAAGLRWFAYALRREPDNTGNRQLFGTLLLSHGCLSDGWIEYAQRPSRLRIREKYERVTFSPTLPTELEGKHLLLCREQGLGDELFFLRYVPALAARGARASYRGNNKLASLLARLPCLTTILDENTPFPPADATLLIGDLPHACSDFSASALPASAVPPETTELADFPRRIAVFWPPPPPTVTLPPLPAAIERIRARLAAAGPPPYIAITWRGGVPPEQQRTVSWSLFKEIGIPPLAAALRDCKATFLALQRNPGGDEITQFSAALDAPVHDFTDLNEDLEAMLALLALIDDYIGVSNTNMHLRAAAGRNARVLVPCPAEWRWMDSGATSPWFPGFTVYRQSLHGPWTGALEKLRVDLMALYGNDART